MSKPTMNGAAVVILIALASVGCAPKATTTPPGDAPPTGAAPDAPPPFGTGEPNAERPSLSVEECEAQGGTIVGDPGDGSTHRESFRCESGDAPIGRVDSGIEGAVCCPG